VCSVPAAAELLLQAAEGCRLCFAAFQQVAG
jgi:hypothetical protein